MRKSTLVYASNNKLCCSPGLLAEGCDQRENQNNFYFKRETKARAFSRSNNSVVGG